MHVSFVTTYARHDTLPTGMAVVTLAHKGSRVTVSPFGAHTHQWLTPKGTNLLVENSHAVLDGIASVRNGIPVIWPQFGPNAVPGREQLPLHGLARVCTWRIEKMEATEANGALIRLSLNGNPNDQAAPALIKKWGGHFQLSLDIHLMGRILQHTLRIYNFAPWTAQLDSFFALHNYFAVPDIGKMSITGLRGATRADRLNGNSESTENEPLVTVNGRTDLIFRGSKDTQFIYHDGTPRIKIHFLESMPDRILWSPGAPEDPSYKAGGSYPADLDRDAYRRFVCFETGVVSQPISLMRGQAKVLCQRLESCGNND